MRRSCPQAGGSACLTKGRRRAIMAVSCCGPLTGAAAKRSKHKEALVLLREQQNCEAAESQKQAGGNAANGLFW